MVLYLLSFDRLINGLTYFSNSSNKLLPRSLSSDRSEENRLNNRYSNALPFAVIARFVSVEDGKDSDGIGSRERSPDGNGIDEAEIQRAGQQSEEPQDQANNDG